MLRKLKWQIPEPLAARYQWCQGPVPGRGPAVEKHYTILQYKGCLLRKCEKGEDIIEYILMYVMFFKK